MLHRDLSSGTLNKYLLNDITEAKIDKKWTMDNGGEGGIGRQTHLILILDQHITKQIALPTLEISPEKLKEIIIQQTLPKKKY